jgi:hypothetical protein|tara:strand:- start:309 stop:473 length:165 start_codon:yes stop_codon:yes gene_type:complete
LLYYRGIHGKGFELSSLHGTPAVGKIKKYELETIGRGGLAGFFFLALVGMYVFF